MKELNKIWKMIADLLSATMDHSKEIKFQESIIKVLTDSDYLGWPESRVIAQYPIQMGSTKKCDIVLLDEDLTSPLVAIEVKLATSSVDGVKQLGSYMYNCVPQLKLGMLFKDAIYIFYDNQNGKGIKSFSDAIYVVKFEPDNLNGEQLVKLFTYNLFSKSEFVSFCEEQLKIKNTEIQKENKIESIRKRLFEDKNIINEALFQYFVREGAINESERDIIDKVLQSNNVVPSNIDENIDAHNYSVNNPKGEKIGIKTYIPSKKEFVERLSKEKHGYKYYVFKDGKVIRRDWKSHGGIDESAADGNITSNNFYRKHKNELSEIVLSMDANLYG